MNIDQYLQRIQISDKPEKTLAFLEKLQFHHVTQVPFENLDILQNIPLSLEISDLYDKIVHQKRGGVCYELNGLFHAFLVHLGFHAQLIAGTVYYGDHWGTKETHATILVTLESNNYLVDVGFGGNSPRKPIPLTGKTVQDIDGEYRIIPYSTPKQTNVYALQKKEQKDWQYLYRFRTHQWNLDDFSSTCEFIQQSPDSPFNRGYFLMNVTENGRKTLFGNSLTIVENGVKTKEKIPFEQLEKVVQTFLN